ncbi:unnamed protein product [Thelazia callipaeda]|uniref:Rab-GAP TBC domain-containing protein n=1 Tax=Thelazia callipaeda TaxID=103827 RepID=A0A0N5D8D6_THECL|nr:unnamed protein product [Thelazia callipaeda]
MEIFQIQHALASQSFENHIQEDCLDDEHEVQRQEEQGRLKSEAVTAAVPGSLATVLENLPLVYDANDKCLQQAYSHVKNCGSRGKGLFKRGHHRRSSYESAEIKLPYHPRQLNSRYNQWLDDKSSTAPSDFMKPKMVEAPVLDRSKRFSRSISFKDDCDEKKVCSQSSKNQSLINLTTVPMNFTAIATVGTDIDSAIGESLSSKLGSLDRQSMLSSELIRDDDCSSVDEENVSSDIVSFFSENNITSHSNQNDGTQKQNKKVERTTLSILPNINFTKISRKLFSRNKHKSFHHENPDAWRLFGNKWKSTAGTSAPKSPASSITDDLCCSTTGLILEDRPSTLPAKSLREQQRHKAQYLALIEAMKRKEEHRARQRQQLLETKRKEEDEAVAAAQIWCQRLLPNWENMKDTKYCRELWWRGLPSKVRGNVWSLAIGNELNLTSELYEICVARANYQRFSIASTEHSCSIDSTNSSMKSGNEFVPHLFLNATNNVEQRIGHENTVELIHLDVFRTFPHLGFFQKGGPYEKLLVDLLGAYVCYRPDIGYVQSMCFLGAMLLLQIHQPYQSFQAFANLLNRPLMLALFGLRQPQMTVYFIAYDQYFEQELPQLHHHLDVLDVRPDLLYPLYAKSLPFDVCCRVWDVFLRDGEQFLFNTALGIMNLYHDELKNMDNFDAVVQFLTHLPESMDVNQLFDAIEPFMKISSSLSLGTNTDYGIGKKRSFLQIYSDVSERIGQTASVIHGSAGVNSVSPPVTASCQNMESKTEETFLSPLCATSQAISTSVKDSEHVDCQQATDFRSNVQALKISKSLSGFLDDLLRGTPSQEVNVFPKRSRAPTAV